ncbi:MAG: ribosome maturation factor RimM [Beijerinckiaceae bacterium]|nr:ribosome maturation factor RimM [Beijerinckiaceae bacterium]
MPQDRLLVGVFGAPHGVRGEVRLKSYTADPMSIASYKGLTDESGQRSFKITSARPVKDDLLVVRVEGVGDRTAAEKLTNVAIAISRASLPPADEEEFYHADLIGLRAETQDGERIGLVANVLNYGAGDILEVRPDMGEALLLPFTRAVVPVVDVKGGRVVIAPPAEVLAREDDES